MVRKTLKIMHPRLCCLWAAGAGMHVPEEIYCGYYSYFSYLG